MSVNSQLLGSYWSVLCWVCVLSPLINLNKSIYSIYIYILYILCLIKRLWKSVLACSNNCFIYYYLCTIEKVLGSIKLWFESVSSVYHTLWCIKSCFHIKKNVCIDHIFGFRKLWGLLLWCMLRKLPTLQRMCKCEGAPILLGESLFFLFKVLFAHLKATKLKDFSLLRKSKDD